MTIHREDLTRHLKTLPLAALLIMTLTLSGLSQDVGRKPDSQAISQTGLLPVYGIDLNIDPAWVDGAQFPSGSSSYPSFGARPVLQKIWDALKAAGYNTLRFEVDVRDAQSSAIRVANLCVWAKNNNVRLTPVLIGAERGKPLGNEYPANVAAFIKALLAALRSGDGGQMEVYTQILAYQLENEMNHAGLHGAMSVDAAQLRLMQTASILRKAEQESLKETGLSQTPIAINASFDYELVKARAMAGAPLTDDAYTKAYDALKQFVSGIALSSDIDVIGVDWFAGSLSAGSVDKFSAILRSLVTDLTGKQVVFTTGFSTGFRSAEEQRNFYALAFNKLAGYRASDGADSFFIGAFFHEALIGKSRNAVPPISNIEADLTKMNWTVKADELARMWNGQARSDAMVWWLSKVEDNFGLLTLKLDSSGNANITGQPAQEALAQVANAVGEANQSAAPETTATETATDSASNPKTTDAQNTGSTSTGLGAALKETAKQGLMGLLNAAFQRLGSYVSGAGSNSYGGVSSGSGDTGATADGSGSTSGSGTTGGGTETTGGGSGATGSGSGATGSGTGTNSSGGVGATGSGSNAGDTTSGGTAPPTGTGGNPGPGFMVDPVHPSTNSKSTVPVRPILPSAFNVRGVSVPVKTSGAPFSMPGRVKVTNPVGPIAPKQEEPTRPGSVHPTDSSKPAEPSRPTDSRPAEPSKPSPQRVVEPKPSKPAEPSRPTGSRPAEPSKPSPQKVVEPTKPGGPRSADGSKPTTPSVVAPPRGSDRTRPDRGTNNGNSGVNRNQTPTRPPQNQRTVLVPVGPSRRR